jgi:NAD(P)-dependent dehydrogenase (short-subunit alcohol dehydrogenase family)
MRLVAVDAIELDTTGVRGDRRFYVVDEDGGLINAKRVPRLLTVRPTVQGRTAALALPRRDEATKRLAAELGGDASSFLHDVRELDSWHVLLDDVRSSYGDDVHALVNNAARTEFRSFWEIDIAEWDDVLATNLRGTYLGCRVVGAHLRERGAGRMSTWRAMQRLRRAVLPAPTTQRPRRALSR